MRLLAPALGLLVALSGCSGATFDDVYGVPDGENWSYFQGSAYDVTAAIEETLEAKDVRVEGTRSEDGGTILTITRGGAAPDINEILIQATEAEGYGARAQLYPTRRPLPRWVEMGVSGRL